MNTPRSVEKPSLLRRLHLRLFYGIDFPDAVVYKAMQWACYLLTRIVYRGRLRGLDAIPKTGPFLLLPNHTSLFDPFWAASPVHRGVAAMASASVMRKPYLGRFLGMLGAFAKMKYTKDKGAMVTLQKWFDRGFGIMLFPEGNRSWTGAPQPILPGIGKLIKRLNCKVVYARLPSAYLVHPRWAKYQRFVPIEVEYDGPYEFDDSWTVAEINEHVAQHLAVTPHLSRPAFTWGYRMAEGLGQLLWACPSCFGRDQMRVAADDGDVVECGHCKERWRVDVHSRLHGAMSFTVKEAHDRILEHFGSPPVMDREAFEATGTALQCEGASIVRMERGSKPEVVGSGTLRLTADGLVVDGEQPFSVSLEAVRGVSVEMGSRVQFRIDGVPHRIETPGQSTLQWDEALRGWRMHVVGSERGRPPGRTAAESR